MLRLPITITAILIITLLAVALPVRAQGDETPRLILQFTIPGYKEIKFPDVAAFGRTVHVSSNADRTDAFYWSKIDVAPAFGPPERLGDAEGQADFSSTTIAVGPDGQVHYVWINQPDRTVYHRSKPAGGTWGPRRVVVSGTPFPVNPDVAIDSNGRIYVNWRDPDNPFQVRFSDNNGISWSSTIIPKSGAGTNFASLATGPNGEAIITFTQGEGDRLQIFAGFWNGSNFAIRRISSLNADWADPTATIDPSGNVYITWRGLDTTGSNSGIFLATYIPASDGWNIEQIIPGGETFGAVNIDADPDGNLHLSWNANAGIGQRVYYSFRPIGGTFSTPISAPNTAGIVFNSRLSSNIGAEAYAHVITELFVGDESFLGYIAFAAPTSGNPSAEPVIEDNAAIIGRQAQVDVTFINAVDDPAEVRWRWNAAPTDDANDSNGWQPYSNQLSITVPTALLDAEGCAPSTLFTQVRNAAGVVQTEPATDAVIIDGGITAVVTARNPYLTQNASQFTDVGLNDYNSDSGATGGDPDYTRVPLFYLNVVNNGDCSGLKDVAIGRSTTSMMAPYTIENNSFVNVLPIPGAFEAGENSVIVRVSDGVGNLKDYTYTFTYDTTPPTLENTGTLTVTSSPESTILSSIVVSDTQVSDNAYPDRGFWGIWVANSREELSDPTSDADLFWQPLEAPGTSGTFTINNWSLATGLNSTQITPGTYYIYVRFLDGAGNPSSGYLTAEVDLDTVIRPTTYLPQLLR